MSVKRKTLRAGGPTRSVGWLQIGGEECPEKFEGLAFGPDLPDGRHLLIVTADNDFVATAPFRVYAFAIDRADLPTFQPQKFDFKK